MKSFLSQHILLSTQALFIACVFVGTAWYLDHKQDSLEQLLRANIERQTIVIKDLMVITDRNGADAVTEAIILDCPKRQEFEDLLVRLDSLSKKDLLTTQQLFDSCGGFYAERKALMVSRLEREYEVLTDNTTLLSTIEELDPALEKILAWKDIIELERNRSTLLSDQITVQAEIIKLLIANDTKRSDVQKLIEKAQDISQSLSVADRQIDGLRAELIE